MFFLLDKQNPDSKVCGVNMGPILGRHNPDGPHVGPMNLAIWEPINVPEINECRWPCCQLTRWGRVTHVCVSKLTIIGSDNGLLPYQRQAIIWTNAGLLLIGPLGTNLSEILIEILTFSFKKICLKVSSAIILYCIRYLQNCDLISSLDTKLCMKNFQHCFLGKFKHEGKWERIWMNFV